MYTDRNSCSTEEYPHGCFCKCGKIIHIKDEELTPPETKIICPDCGFEISYIASRIGGRIV